MPTKRPTEATRFFLLAAALSVLAAGCEPAKPASDPRDTGFSSPLAQSSLVTPTPDDPGTVALTSEIKKVTVFSDRALVTREATAKLSTAPTVYAFKHLPGWVDDGSVRAATASGRVVEVRVGRNYLARATIRPTGRRRRTRARSRRGSGPSTTSSSCWRHGPSRSRR
jgi:hypothetical protein